MTKLEAIAFYNGNVSALARALDIDPSTVYSWGDYPPDTRQLQLERLTELKAEPECRARVLGLPLKREGDRKEQGAH